MNTISQREMRNNSAEVLRRVAGGETILVTNNGRPAALLSPPPSSRYEQLVATGVLRRASRSLDVQLLPEPVEIDGPSSEELLGQLRADR